MGGAVAVITPEQQRRLASRNRVILSERLNWPRGAVSACVRLEQRNHGWEVSWMGENTVKGFERPAGFWGVRDGRHDAEAFAETADGLEELIEAAPPAEHDYGADDWCPYCEERPWRAGFPKPFGR